jgi:AP-4 complex subunit sigma-1
VEHRNYKVVYRRYASLFFLVGVDNDEDFEALTLNLLARTIETVEGGG